MVIGHQISATDRPLDNPVYELYGLTEEIKIVEDAAAGKGCPALAT